MLGSLLSVRLREIVIGKGLQAALPEDENKLDYKEDGREKDRKNIRLVLQAAVSIDNAEEEEDLGTTSSMRDTRL